MFSSKLRIQLTNCKGKIIYKSQIGQSKEKQHQVAYNLALRQAFNSIESLNYSYKENPVVLSYGASNAKINNDEVEQLREEISQLKEEKEKLKEETKVLPQEVKPVIVKEIIESPKPEIVKPDVLIAQEIFNGYQLLDSSSKVIMTIYTSGVKDVFIVKGKDAIIYKKGENWIYSETNEDNLLAQAIRIKF
jgi:predicted nuclease with TOPRIM domain